MSASRRPAPSGSPAPLPAAPSGPAWHRPSSLSGPMHRPAARRAAADVGRRRPGGAAVTRGDSPNGAGVRKRRRDRTEHCLEHAVRQLDEAGQARPPAGKRLHLSADDARGTDRPGSDPIDARSLRRSRIDQMEGSASRPDHADNGLHFRPEKQTRVNFSGRGAATATAGATRPNATPSSPPDSNFRGTNRPHMTGPLFRWLSPGSSARRNSTSVPGGGKPDARRERCLHSTEMRKESTAVVPTQPSNSGRLPDRFFSCLSVGGTTQRKPARIARGGMKRTRRDVVHVQTSPTANLRHGRLLYVVVVAARGCQPTRLKLPTVTWGTDHTLRPAGRQPPWGLTPRSQPRSGTIAAASSVPERLWV
jgi:hypothetical protein